MPLSRSCWSVSSFVLLAAVVALAIALARDPAVRNRLAEITGTASRSRLPTGADASTAPSSARKEASQTERRATTLEREAIRDAQRAGEVSAVQSETPPPEVAMGEGRLSPRPAASVAKAGSRRSTRPLGGAFVRPADYERLIAAVRDEFATEAIATPEAELELLKRAAQSGRPEALLTLGLYLAYATEGGGDPVLAAGLFERARAAGSARALAELGRLHLTGTGLPLDPERAALLFDQARQAGDPEGAFLLAMANRLELFQGAEPGGVAALLTQAAQMGHVGAETTAFILQEEGEVDFGGMAVVVPWLEAAAAAGDPMALYELARYYRRNGRIEDGLRTLLAAAEAGSGSAREDLALGVGQGRITAESMASTLRLVREMTAVPDLVDGRALFLRAFFETVEARYGKNDSDPLTWLRLAAERGEHRAKVARIRIERGEDPWKVFGETGPMTVEQAYLALIDLDPAFAPEKSGSRVLPRPISVPVPPYPSELAVTRQEGRAVVKFVVDADGKVVDATVVEASHPAFAAAALEAVGNWRFKPGQADGKPVATKMKQPFRFSPP